jgi:serine/threonine protein phosphatase PrpC
VQNKKGSVPILRPTEVRERSALSKQLRLDVAQLTDVGRKRPHNEDSMAYVVPQEAQVMAKKGALFIVADGMGGHAAGEVASELAVETVSKLYYLQDDNDDVVTSLLQAIKRANTLIHQRAAENMLRSGMGTTCVSAVLRGSMAYIANVGDSRAYLVRKGSVRQVSQDHSWVEEQVRAGLLTRDQARSHAQRNVITRSLGTQADVDIDIFAERLEEGDTLVLCSDGLSGLILEEELSSIVDKYMPQESVYRLVERANENGGPDNITAIVIRVLEAGWDPYPVSVGGGSREAAASMQTAILDSVQQGAAGSPRVEEAFTQPMPPARLSGPLQAHDGMNGSRPAMLSSQSKRPRWLVPAIAATLLVMLLVLVGGTLYFLQPNLFVNVDNSLNDANTQIAQARSEISSNRMTTALTSLSNAQKDLRAVQGAFSLSSTQREKFNSTQSDFVATTREAINSYNQQSSITVLPGPTSSSNPINSGNINTRAGNIVTLRDNTGKLDRYTLADDHNIYQIDDHFNMTNKQGLPGNPQVLLIAGNSQELVALTLLRGNNAAGGMYSLVTLTPQAPDGALKMGNSTGVDTTGGFVPRLLATWQGDAYVILMSPTQPNKANILDYPITNDQLNNPSPALSISISTSIVSMAAFPNHQLFLLNGDGNVQSLLFGNNSQASSVVVQHPIAPPLSASANSFSLKVNVPMPAQQPSSFLSVPNAAHATFLTTGQVGNTPGLYVADGSYHRVMLLQPVATSGGSSAASMTPVSPTPGSAGGGQAQLPATMKLVQQYTASNNQLSLVRGMSADPQNPVLYLLTLDGQDSTTANFMSINVGAPKD